MITAWANNAKRGKLTCIELNQVTRCFSSAVFVIADVVFVGFRERAQIHAL